MDHSLGESQNYHRPTEEELLDDYLNAIDLLTINEDSKLRRTIEILTIEKNKVDFALSQIEDMKKKIGLA